MNFYATQFPSGNIKCKTKLTFFLLNKIYFESSEIEVIKFHSAAIAFRKRH